jgi:plasmid stabilization system protein ParE
VRIIWSGPAKADLAAIHEYYRDSAPDHAFTVAALAVRAGRLLAERPKLGHAVADTDHREWRIGKTHYFLIYRVEGQRLHISRVVHASQDWHKLL